MELVRTVPIMELTPNARSVASTLDVRTDGAPGVAIILALANQGRNRITTN